VLNVFSLFQILFLTSGQNSANALPDILPATPSTHRTSALPVPFAPSTRQVFDKKLLPTLPMYRA
jgi:hypothetical protein